MYTKLNSDKNSISQFMALTKHAYHHQRPSILFKSLPILERTCIPPDADAGRKKYTRASSVPRVTRQAIFTDQRSHLTRPLVTYVYGTASPFPNSLPLLPPTKVLVP